MGPFVILLRGVMPTGKNKVLMAPLRAALTQAGLREVRTYIQSGNVIAWSDLSRSALEGLVQDVIRAELGADLKVMARTAAQFRDVVARNPFAREDAARLSFSLLSRPPDPGLLNDFLTADWAPDQVQAIGDVLYTCYATRQSASRLNNNFFERKLRVAATSRNFNTMTRLVALSTP